MLRHWPLLLYLPFCAVVSPSQPPNPGSLSPSYDREDPLLSPELLPLFAPATQAGFPAGPPWVGLVLLSQREDTRPLPDNATMERLACENPVAFLENCLRRYHRTVFGYRCVLEKQDRIEGKLHDREVIETCFRERPFSVHMRWLEGAGRADRALYIKGQNDGMMRIHTRIVGLVLSRDPEGKEARQVGRYTIKEFGLKIGMERVLDSWRDAARRGGLSVEFLGEQTLPQAGGRSCWVLHRGRFAYPEEDGITDLVIYIDKESWLQVGSVLRGEDGRLIGEYYFRDLCLNPVFPPGQFTDSALR